MPVRKRPLEDTTKDALRSFFKSFGPDLWWTGVKGGGTSRPGTPDFLVCFKGRFVGVEAKRDSKEPLKPKQFIQKRLIEAAGGTCLRVDADNLREFKKLFRGIKNVGNEL
jgi:hypothetical protein